ncbi:hypothetical protein [Paenibacillus sp. MMO-177]|uniref:hypothetical protein n=1 Tax=Paenibacillus sp. MMO-177 TaxID=3081289 RepID=UPI003019A293
MWGYRVLGSILILRNIYNFRKNKNGMRRYKPLLHDLFISQVIEYVVVDDQVRGDMLDERRTN